MMASKHDALLPLPDLLGLRRFDSGSVSGNDVSQKPH